MLASIWHTPFINFLTSVLWATSISCFNPFVSILPNFHLICMLSQLWSSLFFVAGWLCLFSCSGFHLFVVVVGDDNISSQIQLCQPRQVKFFPLTPVRQSFCSLCIFFLCPFSLNSPFLKMSDSYFCTVGQKWNSLGRVLWSSVEQTIGILSSNSHRDSFSILKWRLPIPWLYHHHLVASCYVQHFLPIFQPLSLLAACTGFR